MKKHLAKILILLLFSILQGCNKDNSKPVPKVNIDCTAFTAAMVVKDEQKVRAQVDAFFASRVPKPDANDKWGYDMHLNSLIAQINACSNLKGYSCYACYQTYPPAGSVSIDLVNNSLIKGVGFFLRHDEGKYNVSLLSFY